MGREIAEDDQAEGEIGSSLFSLEAWAGALQPGWAHVPGSGEGSAAQRVQAWGASLRQSGFHSPGKTEASVCASADLIVNQPPHPSWSF